MLQILHEGAEITRTREGESGARTNRSRTGFETEPKGVSVALSFQHADPQGMLKVYRAAPRRSTNGTILLFPFTFEISSRARSDYRRYRIPVSDYNGMY
jgi:hypothetical protein